MVFMYLAGFEFWRWIERQRRVCVHKVDMGDSLLDILDECDRWAVPPGCVSGWAFESGAMGNLDNLERHWRQSNYRKLDKSRGWDGCPNAG